MIIRDTTWSRIREQFSADEKAALNKTITGHAVCPRGIAIDEDKLDVPLREKIKRLASPKPARRTVRA
jgi:hypothetical protein